MHEKVEWFDRISFLFFIIHFFISVPMHLRRESGRLETESRASRDSVISVIEWPCLPLLFNIHAHGQVELCRESATK